MTDKNSVAEVDAGFYQNACKPEGADGVKMLERMNGGHHAELSEWGFSKISPAAGSKMLDVGCGGGANLQRLLRCNETGTVAGIDYSEVSVEVSRQLCAEQIGQGRCEVICGDVSELPFENAAFDFVTAFETVYFWPDILAGFKEVRRVLADGGVFMVCNEADGTHDQDYEMVGIIEGMSMYKPAELERLLHEAGFASCEVFREPSKSWIAIEARA